VARHRTRTGIEALLRALLLDTQERVDDTCARRMGAHHVVDAAVEHATRGLREQIAAGGGGVSGEKQHASSQPQCDSDAAKQATHLARCPSDYGNALGSARSRPDQLQLLTIG